MSPVKIQYDIPSELKLYSIIAHYNKSIIMILIILQQFIVLLSLSVIIHVWSLI